MGNTYFVAERIANLEAEFLPHLFEAGGDDIKEIQRDITSGNINHHKSMLQTIANSDSVTMAVEAELLLEEIA